MAWTDHRPIHRAARFGNVRCLERLLELGVDRDPRDEKGRTPLHWAAWVNEAECVKVLLDAGANIVAKTLEARGCSLLACMHRKLLTFFPLAQQGLSLAHFAAMAPDAATLRFLMEVGIGLDVRDNDGNYPIHLAVNEGRLDNVKLLVEEAGVDPAKTNDQASPKSL